MRHGSAQGFAESSQPQETTTLRLSVAHKQYQGSRPLKLNMFQQIVRNRAIAAVSVACAAGAATVSYKSFQMDTAPAYADSKKPKLVYFNAPGRAVRSISLMKTAHCRFKC